MERIDDAGRWVSGDGVSWSLVEPSAEWLAARDAEGDAPPEPTPEERIAELEATVAELLAVIAGE